MSEAASVNVATRRRKDPVLTELPFRLVGHAVGFLDSADLASSQSVCKQWRLPPTLMSGALFSLGSSYLARKEDKKAQTLLEAAGARGSTRALCKLGNVSAYWSDVTKDLQRAAEWYAAAAEQGDSEGMFELPLLWAWNRDTLRNWECSSWW